MLCNDNSICNPIEKRYIYPFKRQHVYSDIIFITDPICSHCWAIEPVWRRLILNYSLRVRYIHGGLLPGWQNFGDPGNGISKPQDVVPHWLSVEQQYQQPINPNVWLTDPISNSYILCKALIAIRLLQPEKESQYLRAMREKIFLYGKNMAKHYELETLAKELDVDTKAFNSIFGGTQVEYLFYQEKGEMSVLGARGFPTLIFKGETHQFSLSGSMSYEQLENQFLRTKESPPPRKQLSPKEKLLQFSTWTLREATEVLQCEATEAQILLSACGFEYVDNRKWCYWKLP